MRRAGDKAEIGLVIFIERGRNANNNGVHFGDLRIVGGRGKSLSLRCLDFFGRNSINVGTALGQARHFAGVDVETSHTELLFAVQQGQRKADVPEADDAHTSLALAYLIHELRESCACGGSRRCDHENFRNYVE